MKIASTTTMAKLLNGVAKEMGKDSGMHFRYITVAPETYKRYIDMDLWDAEDYGDYNASTGKLRAIEVEYPSEYYACNNYLTSKELNKIFKNNRGAITYALDDTWQSVDTLLVESDSNPLDMPHEEIADIFEAYGIEAERAKELAKDEEYWFVRNAEDVDVDNTKGE